MHSGVDVDVCHIERVGQILVPGSCACADGGTRARADVDPSSFSACLPILALESGGTLCKYSDSAMGSFLSHRYKSERSHCLTIASERQGTLHSSSKREFRGE